MLFSLKATQMINTAIKLLVKTCTLTNEEFCLAKAIIKDTNSSLARAHRASKVK